jgi:uncharacterized protein YjbI with pentapeptide repeats
MRTISDDQLKTILDNHALWLKDRKQGKQAKFKNVTFETKLFKDVDLSLAHFVKVGYKTPTDDPYIFKNVILNFTRFEDCIMEKAQFTDSDLMNTVFDHCELSHAIFTNIKAYSIDIMDSVLSRAQFKNSDFRSANFKNSFPQDAQFEKVDLDRATLPLSCGSLGWTVDKILATQFAYHFCSLKCEDEEFKFLRKMLLKFANQSHLIEEHDCPKLE